MEVEIKIDANCHTPKIIIVTDSVTEEIKALAEKLSASVIWEADISLLKQTVICFLIYSAILFPIAYFANWMEHSVIGVIIYIAVFAAIFALIWVIQFLMWKRRVKKINAMLKK